DIGLRHEGGGAVHIGRGQCAAGAECCVGLGQAGSRGAGDGGRVGGAGNDDGHNGGGAVRRGHGAGVGGGGGGREENVRRAGNSGPGACCVDGEGAASTDRAGLRHKGGGAVDVTDGERAVGAQDGIGLGQADRGTGQDGCVVGAAYGDGDQLRGAVCSRDGD